MTIYICDFNVKEVFKKYSHKKCSCSKSRIYATQVTGSFLNNYLIAHHSSITEPHRFAPKKKYYICHNLHKTITTCLKAKDSNNTPTLVSIGTISKKIPPAKSSVVVDATHNHNNVITHDKKEKNWLNGYFFAAVYLQVTKN